MSLHRVDARFLLPAAPRTAVVLGALDGWRDGLATAGIVPPAEGAAPDLVVASADHVVDALSLGGRMLIVEGGDAVRPLRRHGLSIRRYLPRPTVHRPQVVIPIDEPAAARYATAHWTYAASTWKRVRNRLADMAFATRMFPSVGNVTAVATHDAAAPSVVRAGRHHGAEANSWLLTPGPGDDLSRKSRREALRFFVLFHKQHIWLVHTDRALAFFVGGVGSQGNEHVPSGQSAEPEHRIGNPA